MKYLHRLAALLVIFALACTAMCVSAEEIRLTGPWPEDEAKVREDKSYLETKLVEATVKVQESVVKRDINQDMLGMHLRMIFLVINRYLKEGNQIGTEMLDEIELKGELLTVPENSDGIKLEITYGNGGFHTWGTLYSKDDTCFRVIRNGSSTVSPGWSRC